MKLRSSLFSLIFAAIFFIPQICSAGALDNWYVRNPSTPDSPRLFGVTYGNGMFIAVGDSGYPDHLGSILTSSDGVTWTLSYQESNLGLRAVTYGNGNFIAVGDAILTSSDGVTWTRRYSDPSRNFSRVCYAQGIFVAVGSSIVISVDNGITWSEIDGTSGYYLNGVAYGNGKFVAINEFDYVFTSLDGLTWERGMSGFISAAKGLAFGKGIFVTVQDDWSLGSYLIRTSVDGITWDQNVLNWGSGYYQIPIRDIIYRNGIFMISPGMVRLDGPGLMSNIITSSDGFSWGFRNTGNASLLFGAGYGDCTFIAVGENGIILQSDQYCISNDSVSVTSDGGQGNIEVILSDNEAWEAVSNDYWITVTSGASGSGSGIVTFSVSPNLGISRTGTISIAGQVFTVTQAADISFPIVQIIAPTGDPSHLTLRAKIDIGGTASDNGDISQVTWSNSRGGSGIASGTISWFAGGISLFPGENVITIVATDTANNTGSISLSVTFNPPQIGIYREGAWFLDKSSNAGWDGCELDTCYSNFGGLPEDYPVAGDWTGDRIPKIGIYRQGMWYLDLNNSGSWNGCGEGEADECLGPFGGLENDIPVVGDWTGDGRAKIGIYRQGAWYLDRNGNGIWDGCDVDSCLGPFGGLDIDIPVIGDWDGNGLAKIGVYREGMWYLDLNGNGFWDGCDVDDCLGPLGTYSFDIPVVGDWTGDGISKIGIYRNGSWFWDNNGNGTWDGCGIDVCTPTFGGFTADKPVIK